VQQIYPTRQAVAEPLSIYDAIEPAGVFVNMVSSLDGRAVVDGHAAGLGSPVDRGLMLRLRAHADCVLNGAGTVRAERVRRRLPAALVERRRARGQPDEPLYAVATGSGDVELPDAERVVVFVAEETPREAWARLEERAEVVVAGDERPDPSYVVQLLRERYACQHVLLEGGPTFNHSALEAGVVDELFLTLAPKLVAGPGKGIVDGDPLERGLDLLSLYEHEAELFLRYAVRP
jgi:2,5-diamino-6-(ribosylamino)-4(3H)-pyrimidinone 5'-phosphate reductase